MNRLGLSDIIEFEPSDTLINIFLFYLAYHDRSFGIFDKISEFFKPYYSEKIKKLSLEEKVLVLCAITGGRYFWTRVISNAKDIDSTYTKHLSYRDTYLDFYKCEFIFSKYLDENLTHDMFIKASNSLKNLNVVRCKEVSMLVPETTVILSPSFELVSYLESLYPFISDLKKDTCGGFCT